MVQDEQPPNIELRLSGHPGKVGCGNLHRTHPIDSGTQGHLDGPVLLGSHRDEVVLVRPDRSESRRHVGDLDMGQDANESGVEPHSHPTNGSKANGALEESAADDIVGIAAEDGGEQLRDQLGVMLTIRVDLNVDIRGPGASRFKPRG